MLLSYRAPSRGTQVFLPVRQADILSAFAAAGCNSAGRADWKSVFLLKIKIVLKYESDDEGRGRRRFGNKP